MLYLASCCLFVCTRVHVHGYNKRDNLRAQFTGVKRAHVANYTQIIRKLYANYTQTTPHCVWNRPMHVATFMLEQANHATIVCTTIPRRNAHGSTRKLRDHRVYNEPTSQRAWWNTQTTRPIVDKTSPRVATLMGEDANCVRNHHT